MILDAGVLISIERRENRAQDFITVATNRGTVLRVTEPVLAQVWRNGPRQHDLGKLIKTFEVYPFADWQRVGSLLVNVDNPDVVDAGMVALAVQVGDDILTGDPDDLNAIAGQLGNLAPVIHEW